MAHVRHKPRKRRPRADEPEATRVAKQALARPKRRAKPRRAAPSHGSSPSPPRDLSPPRRDNVFRRTLTRAMQALFDLLDRG
jgi:hypothetical protein